MTFRAIQSNPALGSWFSTILGKVHAKIEKKLLTSFRENGQSAKRAQFWPFKMTLIAIQPNPSYDMLLTGAGRVIDSYR